MKPGLVAGALALGLLTACQPAGLKGVDTSLLAKEVAARVGDRWTCVMLGDASSGKPVWRSATISKCDRRVNACWSPELTTANAVLKDAANGQFRRATCPSTSPAGYEAIWESGPAGPDLVFVAFMEGERALPSREMRTRLKSAFRKAGIPVAEDEE